MAVRRELEFVIGPDGEVQLLVKGTKGSECIKLTRDLESQLGETSSRKFTSEYYQTDEEEKGRIKTDKSQ